MTESTDVQLESKGLKVAGSRGAILDAAIIESAARPDRHIDMDDEGQADVVHSADEDPRRVKKGDESFFGFRGNAVVDAEDGYVEHVQAHPANEAEVSMRPEIVDRLVAEVRAPLAVIVGQGCSSAANREHRAAPRFNRVPYGTVTASSRAPASSRARSAAASVHTPALR